MSDTSFDQALRAAARRDRPAGICPDAEQLAAFVDRSASATERRVVEAHAADCQRCAEHLALLASITPAGVRQGRAQGASVRRWAWLVPVATAVLVAAVWVRMPDDRAPLSSSRASTEQSPGATDSLIRTEPGVASPDAAASAPSSNAFEAHSPVAVPAEPAPLRQEPRQGGADARDQKSPDAGQRGFGETKERALGRIGGASDRANRAEDARTRRKAAGDAAVPPQALKDDGAPRADQAADDQKVLARTPPPPSVPSASAPAAAKAATEAEGQAGASGAAKPAPPRSSEAMQGPSASAAQLQARAEAVLLTIEVSAGGQRRYRARGDRLEQSDDAGVTWQDVLSNTGVTFTAGACASAGACWFGATQGVVFLRTANDTHRLTLPVQAAVARIATTSSTGADVTLATGERFSTTDAGAHWTRVR